MGSELHKAIGQWRDALVNLTGTNRLLSYRANKVGTLEFDGETAQEVFSKLISPQKTFVVGTKPSPTNPKQFEEVPPEELTSEMLEEQLLDQTPTFDYSNYPESLFSNKTQQEVDRSMRALATKARNELLDRGLSILYVAFGLLEWIDEREEHRSSPLILVPVQLMSAGAKQPHYVEVSDDDIVVNPALTLKLASLGIELPSLEEISEELESGNLSAALEKFEPLELQDGWKIRDFSTLRDFAFAKEAMYRDLLDNEEEIASNLQIQALSNSADLDPAHFDYEEIDPNEIDEISPPENSQLVLDADSSQRSAIEAALQGRSFALDGPPGTGKSQTIANMIGALIKAGKTVLFVSEKIVALEVVRDRLKERGLEHALFELHSSKSSRKDVAGRLGKGLRNISESSVYVSDDDIEKAWMARESLTDFASAMNERREPLGMSFFEVLGRQEALDSSRPTPPLQISIADLSRAELLRLEDAASSLQKCWDLYLQGANAIWHGLEESANIAFDLEEGANSLTALSSEFTGFDKVSQAFQAGELSDVEWVISALQTWHDHSNEVPRAWFTKITPVELENKLHELTSLNERNNAFILGLRRWRMEEVLSSPNMSREDIPDSPSALISINPGALSESFEWFATAKLAAEQALSQLSELEQIVVEIPSETGLAPANTVEDLAQFCDAALETFRTPDVPTQWLKQRRAREQSSKLIKEFVASKAEELSARSKAELFQEEALVQDLARLEWVLKKNSSPFSFLNREYRDAKRELRAFSNGPWAQVKAQIPAACAWQRAHMQYKRATEDVSKEIGSIFSGTNENIEKLQQMLGLAEDFSRACNFAQEEVFERIWASDNLVKKAIHQLEMVQSSLAKWPSLSWNISFSRQTGRNPLTFQELRLEIESASVEASAWVQFGNLWGEQGERPKSAQDAKDLAETRFEYENLSSELTDAFPSITSTLELDEALTPENMSAKLEVVGALAANFEKVRQAFYPKKSDSFLFSAKQLTALEASSGIADLAEKQNRWSNAAASLLARFSEERTRRIEIDFSDFKSASERLGSFQSNLEDIDRWLYLEESISTLEGSGLEPCLSAALQNEFDADEIYPFFLRSVLQQWLNETYAEDARLRDDPVLDRSELVDKFRSLDLGLQDRAALEIIEVINQRRPKNLSGEAHIIAREAEKQRRHMPVRDLVNQTRNVIQQIHPCFMMSPLSVSQYLPPDLKFDVVIFDEASQVTPADSINCIYRGNALIAAGDQKQLPPTSFFSSGLADEDEDTEDLATDFESILDLMKAGRFSSQTLLWHYRSRHEHLIAFSNSSFYENRLLTFPGAIDESDDLGVKFFKVNGIYKRSAGRNNPLEALEVAKRVIHHYETRPDQSLGVVTFSKTQQLTVQQAIDLERLKYPHLDKFFDRSTDRMDSFFVKNLETVQGDERDVMIFSIGYGPDESGKVRNQFGPLNREGGSRRLNVAVTRAKRLVEVVSSMSASQITEGHSVGARHLRRYLDFAERGPAALEIELGNGGLDTESPFEDSVIDVIRGMGYEVQPQVGVGGFRIDIGVKHPDHPGVFMLGVECDGAAYHSSQVARDRDRLRHEILEGLGWKIHHIWGTAWWRQREREIGKLKSVLDAQLKKPVVGRLVARDHMPRTEPIKVVFKEAETSNTRSWASEYEIAYFEKRLNLNEPINVNALQQAIEHIVATESPICFELLVKRLRENSNVDRVGARIKASILRSVEHSTKIEESGESLWWGKTRATTVRRPHELEVRTIDSLPTAELDQAILGVVQDAAGIGEAEVIRSVAEIFGWDRVGDKIRDALHGRINKLLKSKKILKSGSSLTST